MFCLFVFFKAEPKGMQINYAYIIFFLPTEQAGSGTREGEPDDDPPRPRANIQRRRRIERRALEADNLLVGGIW